MEQYLPYIVTVLCSLISGFASYAASRRQSKSDLLKLQKQHDLDVEKMKLEHEYQLKLKQKEMENQLGADLISTMTKEYIRSPAGQAHMRSAGNKKYKK